jgi:hypothetical protein
VAERTEVERAQREIEEARAAPNPSRQVAAGVREIVTVVNDQGSQKFALETCHLAYLHSNHNREQACAWLLSVTRDVAAMSAAGNDANKAALLVLRHQAGGAAATGASLALLPTKELRRRCQLHGVPRDVLEQVSQSALQRAAVGLPPGWVSAIDPTTRRRYYVHLASSGTSWVRPVGATSAALAPLEDAEGEARLELMQLLLERAEFFTPAQRLLEAQRSELTAAFRIELEEGKPEVWRVTMPAGSFQADSKALATELEAVAARHSVEAAVVLRIDLGGSYPSAPPTATVVTPRMKPQGGRIHEDGSIALDVLTPTLWKPSIELSHLILSLHEAISSARVDVGRAGIPYLRSI